MLIDSSYFAKGSRHILNATLGHTANPNSIEVNEAIERYIEENQEEFLCQILGHTLGNRVNAYLVCLDEDEKSKRVDGYDTVCDRLRESFADYVFYRIFRDINTQATMTGLVRLKCANEYVAPIQRQVSTWNRMVDRNRRFAEWARSSDCPLSGISVDSNLLTYINVLNL